MARYDDLDTSAIAYATFVSCVALLVIILLLRALCYNYIEGESERKLLDSHYIAADEAIDAQKESMAGYVRVMVDVTPTKGSAEGSTSDDESKPAEPVREERWHIPVERAQDVLLKELSATEDTST